MQNAKWRTLGKDLMLLMVMIRAIMIMRVFVWAWRVEDGLVIQAQCGGQACKWKWRELCSSILLLSQVLAPGRANQGGQARGTSKEIYLLSCLFLLHSISQGQELSHLLLQWWQSSQMCQPWSLSHCHKKWISQMEFHWSTSDPSILSHWNLEAVS